MRSPRAVAAAIILLLGVPLSLATGIVFGDGAEAAIHAVLAVTFLLLASAAFDFGLPRWLAVAGSAASSALAAIFLMQFVSEFAPQLRSFAYDVLGQRFEKVLGYVFLAWCAGLALASSGLRRIFGFAVLIVVLGIEIWGLCASFWGSPSEVLKLTYLALFLWLLAEGAAPRSPGTSRG